MNAAVLLSICVLFFVGSLLGNVYHLEIWVFAIFGSKQNKFANVYEVTWFFSQMHFRSFDTAEFDFFFFFDFIENEYKRIKNFEEFLS